MQNKQRVVLVKLNPQEKLNVDELSKDFDISRNAVIRCALEFLYSHSGDDVMEMFVEDWIKTNRHLHAESQRKRD